MILVATIVAIALVLALGLLSLACWRFVKSFGAYTESYRELTSAILANNELNMALHRGNQRILEAHQRIVDDLQAIRKKGVA